MILKRTKYLKILKQPATSEEFFLVTGPLKCVGGISETSTKPKF